MVMKDTISSEPLGISCISALNDHQMWPDHCQKSLNKQVPEQIPLKQS